MTEPQREWGLRRGLIATAALLAGFSLAPAKATPEAGPASAAETAPQVAIQQDLGPDVDQPPLDAGAAPADAVPESAPPLSVDGPSPPPAPDGRAFPPMWRITDADSEIYLVGTFHILPPGLSWRSDALARAADLADSIWFEAEIDAPGVEQATLAFLQRNGFYTDGRSLRAVLSADDYERLGQIAGELGLPLVALDRMRPWQAFLALSVQFIASQGFEPGAGVERVLLAEARARGKTLAYFETVEQQLNFFSGFAHETEVKLLTLVLRDWERQEAEFGALFDAWRAGDAAVIDSQMNAVMREEAPEVYETLIAARNRAWAERIERELAGSGRALIAVGAAHLVGEDGVPSLLRARGHTAERYGAR